MIETTTGLVLRTRPLTETSLIVCWLTPNQGRLSTVAKGARRPQSLFRGKLDLFYEAEFSFSRSRRSELHTLREVELRQTHSTLRQDLGRLQQAAYAAVLVEQVTETETPLPGIYELLLSLLAHLAGQTAQAGTIFAFELKLLEELGLQPDFARTKLTPGARSVAAALLQADWATLPHLRLSAGQVTEIERFLGGFLLHHLGRVPKGRGAALGRNG
jgi:DNA repair protein RecO (recombination protein O)